MQQMIEVKTTELEGATLDWAVAVAIGHKPRTGGKCAYPVEIEDWNKPDTQVNAARFEPSTDWAQGGPLIEKYRIEPHPYNGIIGGKLCKAWKVGSQSHTGLLVAACRSIVVRELGDVVGVPAELMP